jgi:hypothetical protein
LQRELDAPRFLGFGRFDQPEAGADGGPGRVALPRRELALHLGHRRGQFAQPGPVVDSLPGKHFPRRGVDHRVERLGHARLAGLRPGDRGLGVRQRLGPMRVAAGEHGPPHGPWSGVGGFDPRQYASAPNQVRGEVAHLFEVAHARALLGDARGRFGEDRYPPGPQRRFAARRFLAPDQLGRVGRAAGDRRQQQGGGLGSGDRERVQVAVGLHRGGGVLGPIGEPAVSP